MKLMDAIKIITTKQFFESNFSNKKIPLILRIEHGIEGSFILDPQDKRFYEPDSDSAFEHILYLLFGLVGYSYDYDDNEMLEQYYDRSNYSTANTFLADLFEDFYLKWNDNKIDFEIAEYLHEWRPCRGKLTQQDVQNIINHYNSHSKYFEIVGVDNSNSENEIIDEDDDPELYF